MKLMEFDRRKFMRTIGGASLITGLSPYLWAGQKPVHPPCFRSGTSDPQEASWKSIGGRIYGAKPDESGPLGGGDHYGGIITRGDFEVSDLGGLIEALEQAKPGDVVYIPDEHVIDLTRSEEHTSELQSRENLVCRLLLEKKKKKKTKIRTQ